MLKFPGVPLLSNVFVFRGKPTRKMMTNYGLQAFKMPFLNANTNF